MKPSKNTLDPAVASLVEGLKELAAQYHRVPPARFREVLEKACDEAQAVPPEERRDPSRWQELVCLEALLTLQKEHDAAGA